MNVINRIGSIFIIDFFETSIDQGYERGVSHPENYRGKVFRLGRLP
jgi:hypothetical protein